MTAKTIFWGNYKGGVGKTTSVFQVASFFAKEGKKVLLIDLDPQCSLSNICSTSNNIRNLSDFNVDQTFNYLIELYMRYINGTQLFDFGILTDSLEPKVKPYTLKAVEKLKKSEFNGNLFFIPSSLSYENCRLNELAQHMSNNIYNLFLIKLFIDDISEEFDYIFFDCPPTSNLLIQSVFLSSDYYIVPTICDEISIKGVADYITEIEKTYNRFSMNDKIGGIMIHKAFNDKPKFIGVFETIYKERRGNADNSDQIINLDGYISKIPNVKSILSDSNYEEYRYKAQNDGYNTNHIFKYYIGNKDNRSGGESIPQNTSRGETTPSYKDISCALLNMLG